MKILLVDDHKLVRTGLALVLKEMEPGIVLFEAGGANEGVELAKATPDLDLVLMDLDLPDGSGLDAMVDINASNPKLPVVILSAMDDRPMITRALDMGARGYIPKSASGDVMQNSLRLVLSGGICLPPGYGDVARGDGGDDAPSLTQRQLEVLRLMAQGNSNKEIARALGISENTVRVHISAIINTMNAANRTEAAYSAMRLGLIPRANLLKS
ncbi:MAG: response regulator transcription factor [Alphaproteobacteria bacterium]|nr:response regulator transcription factor [Alphaproteobacteria bacterium]MBF0251337.1 response regulator transcription factor [Alphaproteobacteria bacterium]